MEAGSLGPEPETSPVVAPELYLAATRGPRKFCMQKVQGKFTELTGGGMK